MFPSLVNVHSVSWGPCLDYVDCGRMKNVVRKQKMAQGFIGPESAASQNIEEVGAPFVLR